MKKSMMTPGTLPKTPDKDKLLNFLASQDSGFVHHTIRALYVSLFSYVLSNTSCNTQLNKPCPIKENIKLIIPNQNTVL